MVALNLHGDCLFGEKRSSQLAPLLLRGAGAEADFSGVAVPGLYPCSKMLVLMAQVYRKGAVVGDPSEYVMRGLHG